MREYNIGDKVCIHTGGIVFVVTGISGRYAQIEDAYTGEKYPLTPMELLDPVESNE